MNLPIYQEYVKERNHLQDVRDSYYDEIERLQEQIRYFDNKLETLAFNYTKYKVGNRVLVKIRGEKERVFDIYDVSVYQDKEQDNKFFVSYTGYKVTKAGKALNQSDLFREEEVIELVSTWEQRSEKVTANSE